jgi:chromosome segregation ATPase
MASEDFGKNFKDADANKPSGQVAGQHPVLIGSLIAGLVLALVGNVYLWNRSEQIGTQLNTNQNTTEKQIARLSEATTTILEQRLQAQNEELKAELKGTHDSANAAVSKARMEAQQQTKALTAKLEEQKSQISEQLAQIHDANEAADSKLTAVSTKVSDVSTDVTAVKADVVSTQAGLQKTGAELARVNGDLGMLSGLIATNAKELSALRERGDRNYFEFSLSRSDANKKVNNIALTLKKADPKKNRYTVAILSDDKLVEKKDKTINEPVQLMVAGNREPYEIVVNRVNKDQIIGYLSTPKVTTKQ